MAIEFQPERAPSTADLPSIPADCIHPERGYAAYIWIRDQEKADKEGGQPHIRHAAAIDVREMLAVGEAILPAPGPYGPKGGETPEAPQEAAEGAAPQPTAEPEAIPGLDSMTKDELLAVASDLGLSGLSVKKKAEIVEAIQAATQD